MNEDTLRQVREEMVALLPRLRRFARGLAGVPDQADDLVQAACERALTRIDQWQPGTRLDSWMFRIVQTIWLDERRAVKVRTGEGRIDAEMAEDELAFDGGRGLEAHMTYEAVRAAMATLPEDQRAVLVLVCVEGQSYKEAAAALDIPIGTVMSRLARARAGLVKRLGESGESLASPAE
ncbi:MAG: RNA polymerase sigma factor [Alphaproteobacteria bacterium]|nr:RNA polymerase sigma factor [Alphaproteobacteria bacterium]MCA0450382.1 RNA polymerase sigma factor [Pseudomonadota bacterium]